MILRNRQRHRALGSGVRCCDNRDCSIAGCRRGTYVHPRRVGRGGPPTRRERPHIDGRLPTGRVQRGRWLRHVEPAGRCALRNCGTPIVHRNRAASSDRIDIFSDPVCDGALPLTSLARDDFYPGRLRGRRPRALASGAYGNRAGSTVRTEARRGIAQRNCATRRGVRRRVCDRGRCGTPTCRSD
jgi:hypothetical protein